MRVRFLHRLPGRVGRGIFDHVGHAVGAICVVDATEVIFPRGIARGMTAAVQEAARGISRELGAPHWPPLD